MDKPEPEDFGLTSQEYKFLIEQLWQGFDREKCGILTNQQLLSILTRKYYNIFDFIVIWIKSFIPSWAHKLIQSQQQQNKLLDPRYQKVALYDEAIRKYQYQQESYWKSLRGVQFEKALANLYRNLGYSVEETKGSHDEGIDLKLLKDGKRIIVQCKGHEKQIGEGAIRDLYGTLNHHTEYKSAVLACPAGFSGPVRKFADGKPIELLTAKELVEMAESISNDKKKE